MTTRSSDLRASQVLVPARLSAERPELKPDIVQVELSEKEQRLVVTGVGGEPSSRERLAVLHVGHEGGDEGWTGHAQSKRFPLIRFLPVRVLVGRLLEQPLELKEQGGCAQLIVGQILRLRAPQGERQRGRGLVSGVVEVVLRVTERMRSDGKRDLVPDRRGPFVPGLVSSGRQTIPRR